VFEKKKKNKFTLPLPLVREDFVLKVESVSKRATSSLFFCARGFGTLICNIEIVHYCVCLADVPSETKKSKGACT
jgi:hypothetical protein